MAQARMLNKAIILSKKINAVSEGAENLYYRLLVNADDFGRFRAEPEVIRGQVYTLRPIGVLKIGQRLQELAEIGLIQLYKVDGEVYLEITKFEEHQKFRSDIQKKEEYPIPVTYLDASDTSWNEPERVRTPTQSRRNNNNNRNNNENRNQNKEGELKEFEQFWEAYPKHIHKQDALKAFLVLRKKETLEGIARATNGYNAYLKKQETDDPKYVMHPATFLRNEKYKDYIGVECKPKL
jgi:hypothetical protein